MAPMPGEGLAADIATHRRTTVTGGTRGSRHRGQSPARGFGRVGPGWGGTGRDGPVWDKTGPTGPELSAGGRWSSGRAFGQRRRQVFMAGGRRWRLAGRRGVKKLRGEGERTVPAGFRAGRRRRRPAGSLSPANMAAVLWWRNGCALGSGGSSSEKTGLGAAAALAEHVSAAAERRALVRTRSTGSDPSRHIRVLASES